jgi:diguanylate cyclase (GGDEF)-like protein
MKILLIEDDALIAEALAKALADQHYAVDLVADGQAGLELLESFTYDLILLDVMLPTLDGISLCRRLRSQGNRTPIVLLTAQDTSTNKVMGLDAGADDYVAKPFDLQELLARIRALLRRGGAALPPLLEWQNLTLDPSICEVSCNHQPLRLTPKEYGLLELFLRNPHRIFSTDALSDHLWSFEESPTGDTIRSHIKGLRQKLKEAGVLDNPIESIYGIGYRLRPAEKKSRGAKTQKTPKSEDAAEQKQQGSEKSTIQNSSSVESQTLAGVAGVWDQVKDTIEQRVSVLEQAVTLLLENKLSHELQQQAEREAHKLAGSLGMFGADEGSRIAQEIEPLLGKGRSLDRHQMQHLHQLVIALQQELQRMGNGKNNTDTSIHPNTHTQDTGSERTHRSTPSKPQGNPNGHLPDRMLATEPVDERPWLMIVSSERSLAETIAAEASSWGMRSHIAASPVGVREQLSKHRPHAVVLDFAASGSVENILTLLSELSACTPPVPAVVLTTQDNVFNRAKVAHLGGYRVLRQPTSPTEVLEAIHQVLHQTRPREARVMVVDDDPQILIALQRLLIPWGLHVTVLDNPLLLLDTLQTSPSDLLILDIEMPHISGIELCQVVRQDPRWSGLPILFLTAHTDPKTMHRVFAAGADDYVSKPIVGPELVTRIFNRLERSRLIRTLSETDALTGVANRRKSAPALTELILWSRHCQQPLCFAIVKLDRLEQINRHYGHAAGDQVLARFGELLRQRFHSEDLVGRWGGGEFVIGMAGLTKEDGMQRLSDLQKTLRHFEFRSATDIPFQATFTAGVAESPQDGVDLQALYHAAIAVLDRAQDAGGDRIGFT